MKVCCDCSAFRRADISAANRAFADWREVFPNSARVVSLIDRLMHRAGVVRITGESYRQKKADERAARRAEKHATTVAANKPRRDPTKN